MPPKKSKGYKMPSPLPKGEVLTDNRKQKWILGPSVGKGGFGEVYSAATGEKAPSKDSDYFYVVKIEPHENGPLFMERTFYLKTAKNDDVMSWMQKKKLKTFGMPVMHGFGSHESGTMKYRFIVMDRFSTDLWTQFNLCNKLFPLATVLQISIHILDVLEYIHSYGYVHADVKGSNLLLGFKKGFENQVFTVDFGLASRFSGTKDLKKRHNGTIEYTSRDAHAGGTTRRGDLEILAYNMVHWLSSKLPWEGVLKNCEAVQKAKEGAMENIPVFLQKCFGKKPIPDVLTNFLKYVYSLEFEEEPDYSKVRKMFMDGLKKEGVKFESPLSFTKPLEQLNGEFKKVRTSPRKTVKRPNKKEMASSGSNDKDTENLDSSIQEISDSADEEEEEEEVQKKKRKVAPKVPPKEKLSWRDCPTVKASRVVRPGEFIPLNPKPKKKN